ncbi:hypothetical protein HK104_007910, partial [Borealophlyctis nickersoniae]
MLLPIIPNTTYLTTTTTTTTQTSTSSQSAPAAEQPSPPTHARRECRCASGRSGEREREGRRGSSVWSGHEGDDEMGWDEEGSFGSDIFPTSLLTHGEALTSFPRDLTLDNLPTLPDFPKEEDDSNDDSTRHLRDSGRTDSGIWFDDLSVSRDWDIDSLLALIPETDAEDEQRKLATTTTAVVVEQHPQHLHQPVSTWQRAIPLFTALMTFILYLQCTQFVTTYTTAYFRKSDGIVYDSDGADVDYYAFDDEVALKRTMVPLEYGHVALALVAGPLIVG